MPDTLFPDFPEREGTSSPTPETPAAPRILRPERQARKLRPLALEQLVGDDHKVRIVWAYVEGLDLAELDAAVRSVEGRAGRPAVDRRLLLALWLYATIDGVGSAREIERLCVEHVAYMWLRGDVNVGRAILTEFRVSHEALLDSLLVKSVASLLAEGLVTLERVAQDGMRVRASAGAGSFRRRDRLQAALQSATEQVDALKADLETDPAAAARRRAAARLRGAQDRQRRVTEALAQLPQIERTWARNQSKRGKSARAAPPPPPPPAAAGDGGGASPEPVGGGDDGPAEPESAAQLSVSGCAAVTLPPATAAATGDDGPSVTSESASAPSTSGQTVPAEPTTTSAPRASTTDPEARIMKMANSGFRPALNCQIIADTESLLIAGIDVVNVGSDKGLHLPMLESVEQNFGVRPAEILVDGGFVGHAGVDGMPDDCLLIGPVPKPRDPARDPFKRLPDDTEKVGAWRERMGTPEAKETYKLRAATAECVNAHVRNRGLRQMPVRGRSRCRSVLLLHALAHNLLRATAIRRKATQQEAAAA